MHIQYDSIFSRWKSVIKSRVPMIAALESRNWSTADNATAAWKVSIVFSGESAWLSQRRQGVLRVILEEGLLASTSAPPQFKSPFESFDYNMRINEFKMEPCNSWAWMGEGGCKSTFLAGGWGGVLRAWVRTPGWGNWLCPSGFGDQRSSLPRFLEILWGPSRW